MSPIKVVRAEGDALSRGVTIGQELSPEIHRSVDFYHRYLERRGVSSEQLHELLTPYLVAAESVYPESIAVMKGMSAGAMIPVLELFSINAFEELEPLLESPEGVLRFLQRKEGYTAPPPKLDADRCSSVSEKTPAGTMLAHNEHWLAGDAGNIAVVVEIPDDGRVPVASPTVVCCLPAVGLNGYGTAQGIGSLTASDDGVGVPRVLVSRSSLEARDRDDAVARATIAGRAGGYGHVFAFADGDVITIETSGKQDRLLEGPRPHTNHYESDLAQIAPPPSEGSTARLVRLRELLAQRPPQPPQDLMEIMRDHDSTPQSICQHPEPTEGEEAAACLFSMIAEPGTRRMWVAAGNPCENEYEEIDLSGLTDGTH